MVSGTRDSPSRVTLGRVTFHHFLEKFSEQFTSGSPTCLEDARQLKGRVVSPWQVGKPWQAGQLFLR